MKDFPEAQRAFDKGKFALLNTPNTAFLTTILFGLRHVWREDIPTLAVDGLALYQNPNYIVTLDEEEMVFALGHECLHVALDHINRGAGLDHRKHNMAGDYVINGMQVEAGMKMPDGWLYDKKYLGMSTRQVYDLLLKIPSKYVSDVIPIDETTKDPAKQQEIQEEVKQLLIQAGAASRASDEPGSLPGEIERMLYDIVHPVLPWQGLLQQYMQDYQPTDYSYKRPNRRFTDVFLPRLYSESLSKLTVAIDMSGSISRDQLRAFLTEIVYIQETLEPVEMNILGFSMGITCNHHIKRGDDILDLSFPGGGGTRITPVLEYCQKEQPTVAIIFTDMYFEDYKIDPSFDIIWVVIDNPEATIKHGRATHFDTRHIC